MAGTHKKQHTIPRTYLSSWLEPVTPAGQTRAIYLVSNEDRTVRRKSPEKSFTETDRYTVHLKDGSRDLRVEHYLGGIESEFQGVLSAVRQEQPLTIRQRAKLCTFTAAMLGRSKKQGDWMLQQRRGHIEKIKEMEKAVNARPITSTQMEDSLLNHHASLVVKVIEAAAPVLFGMTLMILTTTDPVGFITSDAPAVMLNPRAHTFPPMYRVPGLNQKDVEVTLPLSPRHLVLFSHRPPTDLYISLSPSTVDEVNRTTFLRSDKEVVSRTGDVKEFWFSEREIPADAWVPEGPSADTRTQAPETVEAIVAQFEAAKAFHDTWRDRIFLPEQ